MLEIKGLKEKRNKALPVSLRTQGKLQGHVQQNAVSRFFSSFMKWSRPQALTERWRVTVHLTNWDETGVKPRARYYAHNSYFKRCWESIVRIFGCSQIKLWRLFFFFCEKNTQDKPSKFHKGFTVYVSYRWLPLQQTFSSYSSRDARALYKPQFNDVSGVLADLNYSRCLAVLDAN